MFCLILVWKRELVLSPKFIAFVLTSFGAKAREVNGSIHHRQNAQENWVFIVEIFIPLYALILFWIVCIFNIIYM